MNMLQLSLVAKLEPSPDWFVGVDSLNLCENGSWKRYQELELWPLDAGTQRGMITMKLDMVAW